jgi:hypothetical protein
LLPQLKIIGFSGNLCGWADGLIVSGMADQRRLTIVRTRLKLNPSQRGTKKLVALYGDRLVCVRYRYDEEKCKRYKTVELIIDEKEWIPRRDPAEIVDVQVAYHEFEMREQIKDAGGRWNPEKRLWELSYAQAMALGLEQRVVRELLVDYVIADEIDDD